MLGVLRADAVSTLAAVAAAAASAAASASVAFPVAAHAAAGTVALGQRLRLRLAFLSPCRLPTPPLLFLRFRSLVLYLQGWNQRTGALSGGAGSRAACLIGC